MMLRHRLMTAALLAAALAGCRSSGDIVVDQGVGITAVRGACPAVGIPDFTGDVTLFRSPGATTSDNIDVVAAMTNVRSTCTETANTVNASATFDVLARRTDTRGARQVLIPYYVSVLRGGASVVTKRLGQVQIDFADGQERAQGRAMGSATIDRAEATLSEDIRKRITRRRKAGEEDAAIDPLSEPEVKAAVARATFELLVGFQLDNDQLAYNVTR